MRERREVQVQPEAHATANQPANQPPTRRRARTTPGLSASNARRQDDPSTSSPEQMRPRHPEVVHIPVV